MISVDNLTVEFGGSTLFENISFQINEKDRIALMGKNGAGKSTLLKILAGVQKPSKGKVAAPKECVIAYLPQHLMTEDGRTVFEEASLAFSELFEMENEIERLNNELATRTDYDSDEYMELIEQVSTLSEKFYSIEDTNYAAEVEKVLLGLGFKRSDLQKPTKEFSGGWRMRIELAKILLKKPDVILLDEPTNHLDIESIQWLEEFLINSAKAVILISHDRAFVDNITTRTIEVTMGRIYDYKTNYSHYLELRKERREQQQKAYDEQQKMIAETKEFIERFKGTYSKTLQVQSRVKMLEKLQIIEVDEEDTSALRLKFPPSPRSGNYPVIAEQVGKSYDEHIVFKNVSFTIERGDKVAFVGRNGEGKSTLVKLLLRLYDPTEGTIYYKGKNIKEYDYDSYQAVFAPVFQDYILNAFSIRENLIFDYSEREGMIKDSLEKTGIYAKIMDIGLEKPYSRKFFEDGVELSGGEQQRLVISRAYCKNSDVIVLDEPTAAIDPLSERRLFEEVFNGIGKTTSIMISHRMSCSKFSNKIFVMDCGKLIEQGTHNELLDREGLYASMFRLQAQYYS